MDIETKSICCQNIGNSWATMSDDNIDAFIDNNTANNIKNKPVKTYVSELVYRMNRAIRLYDAGFYFDTWKYDGVINTSAGHKFHAHVKHISYNNINGFEIVGKIDVIVLCNPNRYKVGFSKADNLPQTATSGDNYNEYRSIIDSKYAVEKDYDKAVVMFEKCINNGNYAYTVGPNSYLFGALYQHFKGKKYKKFDGKELYKRSGNNTPYDKKSLIEYLFNAKKSIAYLSETVYSEYISSSSHGTYHKDMDVIANPKEKRLVLLCGEDDLITWTCKSIDDGFCDCHLLTKGDSV